MRTLVLVASMLCAIVAPPGHAGEPANNMDVAVKTLDGIEIEIEKAKPSGDWKKRDQLLGGFVGLRPWLERYGLSLELESIDEGFGNPARSDRDAESGGRYAGLTDLVLSLDTEAVGWWRGGTIAVGVQNVRGGDISDVVGDLQGISNIVAPPGTRFVEYHLVQEIADGKATLKVGKQDANADFVVSAGGSEFVNSSFGIIPTVPLPTFPAPALGAMASWTASRSITVKAGYWDGAPALGSGCVKSAFDGSGGSVGAVEVEVKPFAAANSSSTYRLGIWHHSEVELAVETESATGLDVGTADGIYFTVDQSLWSRGERRVALFAQGGWGEADRSAVTRYFGGGLTFHGPIQGRFGDVLGVGIAHAEIGDLERMRPDLKSETVVELFYRASINGWFTIRPDLQWVIRPGGENREAFVAGLRFVTVF